MTTIRNFFGSEGWQKFRNLELPEDAPVGGVCAALGRATPFAAWMWRVLFLTALLAWGTGLLAYIILWICIPAEKHSA
ncbi:MAG TPA: PspC domain-containing protein [Opitutaceae bacterium]|nr:PspC domain-containing protein [Opitutaceae bacterium]